MDAEDPGETQFIADAEHTVARLAARDHPAATTSSLAPALALLLTTTFLAWALAAVFASDSSNAPVGLFFIVPMSVAPAALGYLVGRGVQGVLDRVDHKEVAVPSRSVLTVVGVAAAVAAWLGITR